MKRRSMIAGFPASDKPPLLGTGKPAVIDRRYSEEGCARRLPAGVKGVAVFLRTIHRDNTRGNEAGAGNEVRREFFEDLICIAIDRFRQTAGDAMCRDFAD